VELIPELDWNLFVSGFMSTHRSLPASLFASEIKFSTSRSSGPGGQNVNKVESKVTLQFDIQSSQVLTDEEKQVLLKKLTTQITREGVLMLSAQENRSQLKNKEAVVSKFEKLMARAFVRRKSRKATKPTKGSVRNRIKNKKQHSEKKQWRQKPQ
jgi:ribosome-associated protein